MDLWLIAVIAFGAAIVIGFGIVLVRARADAVTGPSSPGGDKPVLDRAELDAAVGALLIEGKLIPAVKLIRQQTGLGLAEAKAYADRLAAGGDAAAAAPAASPRASVSPEVMARLQQLVAEGKKLQAIKELREHTGLGLREATITVDRLSTSAVVLAVESPAPPADPTDEVMAQVQALVARGKKIQAIKLMLEHAPELDLKRAKEIVDRM
ncbi:hypothetical protein [Jiangella anatolica]|uniref:Ribosomal protein L7/L12 C-terminal domain-containing protein n=1 Tax=Jiangella anatolica TaxID=2670374 RepID=A0A2W2BXB1_9ACTN|nr:hypothetical protein [Jiangella anatolica]PZF85104.1 hypothetical protein C1I92_05830 [Jiangella anatolica]